MGDALLPTKLYMPPPRAAFVSRPRLAARLDDGVRRGHRLVLLSAPAGYGKSTLLAEWLQVRREPFAWLSLDRDDNDVWRFLTYLVAALQQIDPALGRTAIGLLASSPPPQPDAVVTTLISDLTGVPRSFSLVLDDYHCITSAAVHDAVALLLDQRLPAFRLIISTREDPPLPLARLRVQDLITEIRAADLRFATDEAALFFNQTMGLCLNAETVSALEARTEGWIAGLQLAALSLQGEDPGEVARFVDSFSGSHRYVIDYLVEEVLRRQTETVRDFLQQTAFLEYLSAPLCDAVTGRNDSRAMLAYLERANLFLIPLDHRREWYRYHQLFADALRTELSLDPRRTKELHRRAASWFGAHGYPHAAIKHALAGEAWDEAGALIEQIADDLFGRGEFRVLRDWLDTLPDSVVLGNIHLATLQAWVAFVTGDIDLSIRIAETLDSTALAETDPRSWGRLVSLRAHLATGSHSPEATGLARHAPALIDRRDPLFRQLALSLLGFVQELEGETTAAIHSYEEAVRLGRMRETPIVTMHLLNNLVLSLIEQGRYHEAQALYESARNEWADDRDAPLPMIGLLSTAAAALAYEVNNLHQARDHAIRAREATRQWFSERTMTSDSNRLLILAYAGLGEWDTAMRLIQESRRLGNTMSWFAPPLTVLEANLQLRRGNVLAVASWAETLGLSPDDHPKPTTELQYLTYTRLLLVQGRPYEALHLLTRLEGQVRAGERFARLITIRILQALGEEAGGNLAAARDLLAEAVRMAAPVGYLRRFLDEDPALARLLPSIRFAAPDFVDCLLHAFGERPSHASLAGPDAANADPTGLLQPLTAQERTVLALLAEGLSNRAIAERLAITPGTAKWHVHNICAKLGVRSRTQGIVRARELGLL